MKKIDFYFPTTENHNGNEREFMWSAYVSTNNQFLYNCNGSVYSLFFCLRCVMCVEITWRPDYPGSRSCIAILYTWALSRCTFARKKETGRGNIPSERCSNNQPGLSPCSLQNCGKIKRRRQKLHKLKKRNPFCGSKWSDSFGQMSQSNWMLWQNRNSRHTRKENNELFKHQIQDHRHDYSKAAVISTATRSNTLFTIFSVSLRTEFHRWDIQYSYKRLLC